MIRLAWADMASVLTPDRFGVFAIKQLGQLAIYGQTPGVFELWLQQAQTGAPVCAAVSRFSGVLTVTAAPDMTADALVELIEFLLQIGGDRLEGEQQLLLRLGIAGDALLPFFSGQVMRLPIYSGRSLHIVKEGISLAGSLTPVYQLLCAADEHFAAQTRYDAWLADFSHRCRHHFSECYILTENDTIVSTLSISFFSKNAALVGGVATHPVYRAKGYAGRLLGYIEKQAQTRGLSLWLLAVDEPLASFYQKHHWEGVSRWVSRALAPV